MTEIRDALTARADELLAAAFDTTMDVLNNKDAPPTARASATASALKIHDLLVGDGDIDKDASEMSYDEIQASLARLRKEHDERAGGQQE